MTENTNTQQAALCLVNQASVGLVTPYRPTVTNFKAPIHPCNHTPFHVFGLYGANGGLRFALSLPYPACLNLDSQGKTR